MGLIAWIVLGLGAGLLANMLIPGRRSRGLVITCLIGVAVLRGRRAGLRAAGAVDLHPHPGRGHENDLRGGSQTPGQGQAALGGPLRGERP